MGLFNRNKLDKKSEIFFKKIEGFQISGYAFVKTHGAKPLMDYLPEGSGRFYLKNNGSCLVVMNWDFQGRQLSDEIELNEIRAWGYYANFPIFKNIDLENGMIEEPRDKILCIEDINSSVMFIQVSDHSIENSFHIRNWLEKYYPNFEKFASSGK
jgi:hypothetical protein